MPRLSANLSMLYAGLAFFDGFAAAARDDFPAAEHVSPQRGEPRERRRGAAGEL